MTTFMYKDFDCKYSQTIRCINIWVYNVNRSKVIYASTTLKDARIRITDDEIWRFQQQILIYLFTQGAFCCDFVDVQFVTVSLWWELVAKATKNYLLRWEATSGVLHDKRTKPTKNLKLATWGSLPLISMQTRALSYYL